MGRTRGLLSLGALLIVAGCTDNSITSPYRDAAGTYQLTVFAGRSLPATYTYQAGQISALPNGGTIQWTDGTMVLNSDRTFVETNNYTITPTGGTSSTGSFTSTGTYRIDGTAFTLSSPAQNQSAARSATGSIELDTINYDEDNGDGTTSSYEYRR